MTKFISKIKVHLQFKLFMWFKLSYLTEIKLIRGVSLSYNEGDRKTGIQ
jgi:hypothetical protein